MLDEKADSKDTMLHVISELHDQHIVKNQIKWLVLEGDAKPYEIIQVLKFEYGSEFDWVIAYPGDWHLLKNYQNCLMKPFYEAGLKDLASVSGYPLPSIQNCTQFQRTHHFLLERHMLQQFIKHCSDLQMTSNCAESPDNIITGS